MTSLPEDFAKAHSTELIRALDHNRAVVSVRVNPVKPYKHNYTDAVAWCNDGFYLLDRPVFTLDPVFAAGGYYVQEAGSMFVGWVAQRLDLPREARVLDLCAAPGGKSTHLSSVIGAGGVLVSNETISSRAGVLAQNIQKWGTGNVVVTSADAASFGAMGAMFDLVVVDAPCSGEGMFRKDDTARREWSSAGVEKCAARQRRIVADVWASLREGGYIIYSTCTFNEHENERNAEWIARELGADKVEFEDLPVGVSANASMGYNFYPHLVRSEGFYAAVLRKTTSEAEFSPKLPKKSPPVSEKYTRSPIFIVDQNGSLYGYSSSVWRMVEALRARRVYMLYAGTELGAEIRGELKPSHALALSILRRDDMFVHTELDLQQAQEYLRRGALDPSLFAEGLNLVFFSGLALGFAKRIGGRVNNNYPQNWRIVHL